MHHENIKRNTICGTYSSHTHQVILISPRQPIFICGRAVAWQHERFGRELGGLTQLKLSASVGQVEMISSRSCDAVWHFAQQAQW